ncbi:MAG: flagellar biosynthesis protein FlhF, partial [gamma proteobacterium symbiont of Bathyaustriella thionipta]|nr:flagellar biosynthesis protein FlhF [gamma proteobacterium symbiont of Bathyaustriella thionipta]
MKIKRFFASEMREAIRQVKDELGSDAVILSNNKVDGGIELVAAIDYDEDAVHRSLDAQSNARQPSNNRQQASSQQQSHQQDSAISKKKKRSVFAKIKKQKPQDNLADAIVDDVINFSHSTAQAENPLESQAQSNRFADLLAQSGQNPPPGNKQSSALSKANADAYSKPSIQDRKQPFISDFNDNDTSAEDAYPFDYESLVKEEHNRSTHSHAQNIDDFFGSDKQAKKANSRSKSRNDKSGKIEWAQDPALTSMQEEIKSLRGILENQLSGLAWGSFSRNHPHHAELLSRLYRLGIKSSLSEKLVKQLKTSDSDSLEDSWRRVLSIIAKNISMMKQDLIDEGGIVALVGPTGVGKTTNIAKLAARFTLKYGAKNLALVTTDSYRVGAHEQLKTYGRILGVPVYVANDEDELKQVLSRLDDKKLVLIDTAGMSHRDL